MSVTGDQTCALPTPDVSRGEYVDGEVVEQQSIGAADPTPDAPEVEMATAAQTQKLGIIRGERYAKTDKGRRDWFTWVAGQLGREINSNTELTKAEATNLIDALEASE